MVAITYDISSKLNPEQQSVYQQLTAEKNKSVVVAMLLALCLGAFGAHKFYQGKKTAGILYLVFCWTLLPVVFSLVDLFFIPGQISWNNSEASLRAIMQVSPNLAKDIQTLISVQNNNSFMEVVIKIVLGILSAWLIYVSISVHSQKFDTDEAKVQHWIENMKIKPNH